MLLPSRMGGVRSGWGRSTFSYTRDHDGDMAPPGVPVRRRHLGPKDLPLLPSRVGGVRSGWWSQGARVLMCLMENLG